MPVAILCVCHCYKVVMWLVYLSFLWCFIVLLHGRLYLIHGRSTEVTSDCQGKSGVVSIHMLWQHAGELSSPLLPERLHSELSAEYVSVWSSKVIRWLCGCATGGVITGGEQINGHGQWMYRSTQGHSHGAAIYGSAQWECPNEVRMCTYTNISVSVDVNVLEFHVHYCCCCVWERENRRTLTIYPFIFSIFAVQKMMSEIQNYSGTTQRKNRGSIGWDEPSKNFNDAIGWINQQKVNIQFS